MQIISFRHPNNPKRAYYNKPVIMPSENKTAVIFVHGYNSDPQDVISAYNTIDRQINPTGCDLFGISWASNGNILSYFSDRRDAEEASLWLHTFIFNVLPQHGYQNCHIVAHSMGSFLVMECLRLAVPSNLIGIKTVSLMAGDVPEKFFRKGECYDLRIIKRLYNYYSPNDSVLKYISQSIRLQLPFRHRLGTKAIENPPIDYLSVDANIFLDSGSRETVNHSDYKSLTNLWKYWEHYL